MVPGFCCIVNNMPTLKQKVETYERLLHNLHTLYAVTMDMAGVQQTLNDISNWSYAHRVGNGMLTARQQNKLINEAFNKLV